MKRTIQERRSGACWSLIQSKVHHENVAHRNLQRLGVQTFYPRLSRVKTFRGKLQNVEEALFPGYLFVKMDALTEFRKVAYAQGVLRVVTFGSKPAVVSEEIIQSIHSRIHDGVVVVSPDSPLKVKPGQTIRVQKGPFSGFDVVFEQEFSGTQRVALLLKAVAYQGRIIIDRHFIGM
jgi:transcriptional antiterminator RfaH